MKSPSDVSALALIAFVTEVGFFLFTSGLHAEPNEPILHVYGPEGTSNERRVLAVVELPDGRCAPWSSITLGLSEEGVTLEAGEQLSDCVRWLDLSSESDRQTVMVTAVGEGWEATTVVGLEGYRGLEMILDRRNGTLTATLVNAPLGETMSVTAYWADGEVDLEVVEPSVFVGQVPPRALVGVVARSRSLLGAALSAGTLRAGPRAIIMPSNLAIPSGGAPRTAAFLVVTNRRGRPSSHVPIRVASERGSLRRLDWVRPGLARIDLYAPPIARSVDLRISARGTTLAEGELTVVAGWPVRVQIDVPPEVVVGESVQIGIAGNTLDGEAIDPALIRVRCDSLVLQPEDGNSVECSWPDTGSAVVTATVHIDGRDIPLASRTTEIVSPPPPPSPPPSPPEEETPSLPPETQRRSELLIGGLLQGGVDTWARGTWGVGLYLEARIWRWLRFKTWTRYSLTPFSAESSRASLEDESTALMAAEDLQGVQHNVELLVGGSAQLLDGRVSLILALALGGAYSFSRAELGTTDASGEAWRLVSAFSIGPRFTMGRMRLDVEARVQIAMASTKGNWDGSPVGFMIEVSGGAGVRE